jgi:gliding motility-associated-like protein
MLKRKFIFLFVCAFGLGNANAQKWSIKHPFIQKVFIENNGGQFDDNNSNRVNKVLYSVQTSNISLSFTSKGITYRYQKYPHLSAKQIEEQEKNEGKEREKPEPKSFYFNLEWKGANPNVEIIAEDEVTFYYCYPNVNGNTTTAHAFKKLLYKNLYKGIDVEYSLPEDKQGIEYSIIVHPGADLAQVKLIYPDAMAIKDSTGDINVESAFGEFINQAPANTFYKEDNSLASSHFVLSRNEIEFYAGDYDKNKTLVIDPWVIDPGMTPYDGAYALRYDLQGNVYAYGGGSVYPNAAFQLIKLNKNGSIQWVYTPGYNTSFGDIAVDIQSGSIYIAGVFDGIDKVSPIGIEIKKLVVSGASIEKWRLGFDNCTRQIIVGTGGNGDIGQGAIVDTNLSSLNSINYLGAVTTNHDNCLLTVDEENGYCYMAVSRSIWDMDFDNTLSKCPINGLVPTSFSVSDGFSFEELYSVKYVGDNLEGANGFNGMAVSPNWLYAYDGSELKEFDKNNGSLVKSINITNTRYDWAGLDVDRCNNIYVGDINNIDIYDANLNKTGSIAMPSTSDTIYDIRVGDNLLYACGKGFVAAYQINVSPLTISINSSPACSGCNGTAYVSLNECYANGATYLWSNGQTSQAIGDLCAGTYSVTVMEDCVPYTDSVTVVASSSPSVNIPTSQINQINCIGVNNGSVTANASGGTPPYTFTWIPTGETGSTIDNLGQGLYSVLVTDANGCSAVTSVDMNSKDYQLFVPDAFSPNGDGQNDYLYVRSNCLKAMDFVVFDRWGNKVFETTDQDVPWDGRYKGEPMNTGTYVYYLKATLYDGSTQTKKGDVTLVR